MQGNEFIFIIILSTFCGVILTQSYMSRIRAVGCIIFVILSAIYFVNDYEKVVAISLVLLLSYLPELLFRKSTKPPRSKKDL